MLLRQSEQCFYCLWGHRQHFPAGKTREQQAREEADAMRYERDRAIQNAARLREERDAAERRASAARGVTTRLKNRAAAGVCPCCNRTFQQLARHMSSQHPNYTKEPVQ